MQIYITDSRPTVRSQGSRLLALRTLIRMEEEAKEETKIRELEVEISKARNNGKSVDSLLDERRRKYEEWIERLDKELEDATDEATRNEIKRQRERASEQYG